MHLLQVLQPHPSQIRPSAEATRRFPGLPFRTWARSTEPLAQQTHECGGGLLFLGRGFLVANGELSRVDAPAVTLHRSADSVCARTAPVLLGRGIGGVHLLFLGRGFLVANGELSRVDAPAVTLHRSADSVCARTAPVLLGRGIGGVRLLGVG
jgi:hypothetical protein